MQAKFTALKLNAMPVDLVKQKKKNKPTQYSELSHTAEKWWNKESCKWTTQKHYRAHVTAYQSIHLSKLFYGTSQAESQLTVKQNRFFRIHKVITCTVHYVSLHNLSALSQVTAERPLQKAGFFCSTSTISTCFYCQLFKIQKWISSAFAQAEYASVSHKISLE